MTFFTTTGESWDALYDDLLAAKKSIFLEQYIFMRDEAGMRFFELFAQKAREGVKVRLVLDAIGSGNFDRDPVVLAIRDAGGIVDVFNPIRLGHIKAFPRDHCKTVVIDSDIAYVGSACVSKEMREWRDTQVRIRGSVVKDIERTTQNIDLGRYTRFKTLLQKRRTAVAGAISYIVNLPYARSPIYHELLVAVKTAQREIILVTPYMILPRRLWRALKIARKRGVAVSLMVSESGDVPFADAVSQSYFDKILREGIKIWMYGASVLHAKYAIIDEQWATVGSTNLDYLSLLRNREGNMFMNDERVARVLKSHFIADVKKSREVTLEWVRNRSLLLRAIGFMGRLVKRYM